MSNLMYCSADSRVAIRSIPFGRPDARPDIPAIFRHLGGFRVRPPAVALAQALDYSPAVDPMTDRKPSIPPSSDPQEAPDMPPTEPAPPPVQDPPAEPDPAPYVVRGTGALRGVRTMTDVTKDRTMNNAERKERRGF